MAWTTPKTFTATSVLTAAEMNTYVSNNTAALAARAYFVPLTTPLVDDDWGGNDTKSVSANNALDLNAVFGLPTGAKAVLISGYCNGSGTVLSFHTKSGSNACVTLRPVSTGYISASGIVPIDTANTIYWTVANANATNVYLEIIGYWL